MSEGFNMEGFISESNPEVIALGNQISDLRSQLRRERKENEQLRSAVYTLCQGFQSSLDRMMEIKAVGIKLRWNLTMMILTLAALNIAVFHASLWFTLLTAMPVIFLSVERAKLEGLMDFVIKKAVDSSGETAKRAEMALDASLPKS